MNVKLANSSDEQEWDAYIQQHSDGSPYHLWAWKKAIEGAYRHKGYYFIAEKHNKICGILPLIYMRLPLMHNQLVSLPFCDLGGILADDDDIEKALVNEALSLGKKLKADKIELRTRNTNVPSVSLAKGTNKVSMLLNLPDTSTELWESFKSKLRSQIRKAEKNGLCFKWKEKEGLNDFYKVFSLNMRDLGSPVHSRQWIASVLECYGEKSRMGLVYLNQEPVGCGMILTNRKKVCIPWASTLRAYNRLNPNMLLYWNYLKFSADNGYEIFDFGRSTLDEGTYKFKAQWGAKPIPLQWKTIHARGYREGLEAEDGGLINQTGLLTKRKLAEKIWQKLPVGFVNNIGPVIRKYISL